MYKCSLKMFVDSKFKKTFHIKKHIDDIEPETQEPKSSVLCDSTNLSPSVNAPATTKGWLTQEL